jgi:hypothetical protein
VLCGRGARRRNEGQCKAAAGGITDDCDRTRFCFDQSAKGRVDVIERSREAMLGRKPIVGNERGGAGAPGDLSRKMPEGGGAAGDVCAAVEVEDCATCGRGARTTPDAAHAAHRTGLVRDVRSVRRLLHRRIKRLAVDVTLPGRRCGPNLIHDLAVRGIDGMNDVG